MQNIYGSKKLEDIQSLKQIDPRECITKEEKL